MINKRMLIIILIFVLFILTGCWGKKELSEIGIVKILGIDEEPNGDVRATIISIEPTEMQLTSGSGTSKSNAVIFTATGNSVMEATRNLKKQSSKYFIWFHNEIVIINQKVSKKTLNEVWDFFTRGNEPRYTTRVLISEESVLKLLQVPSDIESNLESQIEGMIRNNIDSSLNSILQYKDIAVSLESSARNFSTAIIKEYTTDRNNISTNTLEYRIQRQQGEKTFIVYLEGMAVFKQSGFVCKLDGEQTRGFIWMTKHLKCAEETIQDELQDLKKVSICIQQIKRTIKPEIRKNKIVMCVDIDMDGEIIEYISTSNLMNENLVRKIEKVMEKKVQSQIISTERISKQHKTDIFGFSRQILRKYPKLWKKIEKDWDEIYPKVKIEYNIKVKIKRFGEASSLERKQPR